MARGWESKSVEAQIDAAEAHLSSASQRKTPNPEMLESIRRKENLLLSRTRVLRELESAQNPRYKVVLTKALADLEMQIATLDTASADNGLKGIARAAHS